MNLKTQFEAMFNCSMKTSQATGGYYHIITSNGGAKISLIDGIFRIDCNGFLASRDINEVFHFIDTASERIITINDMKNIYSYC